jgi:hypothetical protein
MTACPLSRTFPTRQNPSVTEQEGATLDPPPRSFLRYPCSQVAYQGRNDCRTFPRNRIRYHGTRKARHLPRTVQVSSLITQKQEGAYRPEEQECKPWNSSTEQVLTVFLTWVRRILLGSVCVKTLDVENAINWRWRGLEHQTVRAAFLSNVSVKAISVA